MPCWTVAKSEVKLEKMNPELLQGALRASGFEVWTRPNDVSLSAYRYDANGYSNRVDVNVAVDGTVTLSTRGGDLAKITNEVKRAYSVQVVQAASRKFGWNVKQTGEFKYAVQKRGF